MVRSAAPASGRSGGSRAVTRAAFEKMLASSVPRVSLLLGGDPVVAQELAASVAGRPEFADPFGAPGGSLFATEVKLRDLASRFEELPLMAAERVFVVKAAEALLKNDAAALARSFPPDQGTTAVVLVSTEVDARPARKSAARWEDVLPAHAVRVSVGPSTLEDAIRWGRAGATGAGIVVEDSVWKACHKRAAGDGARLRTDIELVVLGVLSGLKAEQSARERGRTLEEASETLGALVAEGDWRALWPAAERFRALGGQMDARGPEWVSGAAERVARGDAAGRDALHALALLQMRWRRETGEARKVLERSALELTWTRLKRTGERR